MFEEKVIENIHTGPKTGTFKGGFCLSLLDNRHFFENYQTLLFTVGSARWFYVLHIHIILSIFFSHKVSAERIYYSGNTTICEGNPHYTNLRWIRKYHCSTLSAHNEITWSEQFSNDNPRSTRLTLLKDELRNSCARHTYITSNLAERRSSTDMMFVSGTSLTLDAGRDTKLMNGQMDRRAVILTSRRPAHTTFGRE